MKVVENRGNFEIIREVFPPKLPRVQGETPKQLAERLSLIRALAEIAPQLRSRRIKDAKDVAEIMDFLRNRLAMKSVRPAP